MKANPFKFLDSFTKEDRDIFFGREKEADEIYSRVFQSNLLLVYGASGTGKTSLIQCGLANKFNDSDWLPVIIRRGANILESAHSNLHNLAITPLKKGTSLKKALQSLYLDHFKPVYLIFDQFEELFIFGSPDEIKSFISEFTAVVKSDLQCKFIFVIRGEYLEHLNVFEEELPEFLNNRIRIEKMTRLNAAEAITGPCRTAAIAIEDGFVQNLLEKLSPDKTEVELTYLQVFLDKLYRKAIENNPSQPEFTNRLLDQLGKISDVLSDFLEEQIAKIPESDTALTVLKSFVSLEGTKKLVDADEIEKFTGSLGKRISRDTIDFFLHQFVDLRILRDKDENNKYELRHDSLASKIYEKITVLEKELIEVRSLIESAHKNYIKRNILLSQSDLLYIAPFRDKLFLDAALNDFLDASKREATKTKRRKWAALVVIVAVLFFVLSGFSIWALRERSNALEQSKEAEKQRLMAEQQTQIAIQAKDEALAANQKAVDEKNKAELNEKQALVAKQQAERSRQEALAAKGIAEKEKLNAQRQSEVANKEKNNAEAQKIAAEQEKAKAETAEMKSRKLKLLSIAQNLALKSPVYKKNKELMGLLAVQAFKFNDRNGGAPDDPVIYEALRNAYNTLDSNKHSVIGGPRIEMRALAVAQDTLISADLDGIIYKGNYKNGIMKPVAAVSYASPVNTLFFNCAGTFLVTGHDNSKVCVWEVNNIKKNETGNSPGYKAQLTGHRGLIRSAVFSPDGTRLATAGKDSSIIIWNLKQVTGIPEKEFKATAAIKALAYSIGGDTLISASEDGRIMLWDIGKATGTVLHQTAIKPLCLALNKAKNILLAGYSDGSVISFDLNSSNGNKNSRWVFKAHATAVEIITFNNDFTMVATAASDKIVRFYNFHSYFENYTSVGSSPEIKEQQGKVKCIVFTPGKRIIAGCTDRNLRIWETSNSELAAKICSLLKAPMTEAEWKSIVGEDVPYENTCVEKK